MSCLGRALECGYCCGRFWRTRDGREVAERLVVGLGQRRYLSHLVRVRCTSSIVAHVVILPSSANAVATQFLATSNFSSS